MKAQIVGKVVRQGNTSAVVLESVLIPIPESLENAPDNALVRVTPCGRLRTIPQDMLEE